MELLCKVMALGLANGKVLTALTGVGAAFEARMGRFELPVGGDDFAFDEAEIDEQLHHDVHGLLHDPRAHAFSEVAEAILSRDRLVETGQIAVAATLFGLFQVTTEAGVVGVAIDFGRDFQKQEARCVVAGSPSGAIGRRAQVAGELPLLPCKDS